MIQMFFGKLHKIIIIILNARNLGDERLRWAVML